MQGNTVDRRNGLLWASIIVLAGSFCLQYWVDLGDLLGRWDSEDFSYCYLVPLVFLCLVYIKRDSLKRYELRPSHWGMVVLLLSGAFYTLGKLGSVVTLIHISLWITLMGLTALILGIAIVKSLGFPFLILGFIIPLPPFLNNLFTFKLKLIASSLSIKMIQLFGISVFREGNIIDLGVMQLQVVDACSGLRYVYPLLLIALLFAYLFHKKWWERAIMVLAAIPIAIFSNALRIGITVILADKVSLGVAEGFFHDFSGWLIFMVSFVVLLFLSQVLKIIKPAMKKETPMGTRLSRGNTHLHRHSPQGLAVGMRVRDGFSAENKKPVAGLFHLKDISIPYLWVASILLLSFWGLNSALAAGRIKPERLAFEDFPAVMGDWKGERTYLREEILNSLWADDYVHSIFRNARTGDLLLLFVPYYEYQGVGHTAHSPVSCLVGGGFAPRSRNIIERDFRVPFGKVKISRMILEKDGQLLLSNYWFQQRGRIIDNEYWNKWYLFWDSISRRRTDGALVRLEMPLRNGQDIKDAQALLDSFILELMEILPRYVPN